MQAALSLAQDTGDIVHQSRCLIYLTILYRKLGHVERARRYATRSLDAAKAGQMVEYLGMTRANLAWLAWREEDLDGAEAEGQAALDLWQKLPTGHASCAFQWTALWPLAAVALAQNRLSDASRYMCALLAPTQQRLPEDLAAAAKNVAQAWEGDSPEEARGCLDQALKLAQELGYL
jgi:hypothetical protein